MGSFRGYPVLGGVPRFGFPRRSNGAMGDSRDTVIRQIRQCELDRLTTDDPRVRDKLRKVILQLQTALAQMEPI